MGGWFPRVLLCILGSFWRYIQEEICSIALMACWIHGWMGCLTAVVCIRVKDWRILLDRRRCARSRHVSTSNAEVVVVQNAPRMAFIAVLCVDSNFDSCGG